MRQILLSTCLLLFLSCGIGLAQTEYPVATPTDSPDVVISPFDENRRLDVAGLEPGSLAEDPIANKIFRIPFSNPTQRYYEDFIEDSKPTEELAPPPPIDSDTKDEVIPPPPVKEQAESKPKIIPEVKGPNSPSWVPTLKEIPQDLYNFIYAFNQNSGINQSDALLPFYANPVQNYFGKSNFSHAQIKADRAGYIKRWPQREYYLEGTPVYLGHQDNVVEVLTRVRYRVTDGKKVLAGTVSHNYKIRRGNQRYEILSINEARASAAPENVVRQDIEQRQQIDPSSVGSGPKPSGQYQPGTVYSRFEIDQLALFLDAFAASGEVNEPGAQLDFLHPNIAKFYHLENPSSNALLKERRDFIRKWPSRRYWLTEKPIITPLSSGSWRVISKTGWEVKNGSKTSRGVVNNHMRITHTPAGLKVMSVFSK